MMSIDLQNMHRVYIRKAAAWLNIYIYPKTRLDLRLINPNIIFWGGDIGHAMQNLVKNARVRTIITLL